MEKKKLNKLELDIYEETLDNGLRIFVIPKSDVNNVYVTFSTKYGSIQNEFVPIGEKNMIKVPDGVAHFLEHKVFEQEDGEDPFNYFSKSGSDCNANTTNYKTTYLFVGQEKIKENINYLLDFVQTPYFTDKNVEKEKGIIEQELKMYQDDIETSAIEKVIYNSFNTHPIKIPVGGTVESIYEITKEDLYKCYNTFYHPSNMFVVVTGNVDPEEVIDIIKKNQSKKKFDKASIIKLKEYEEEDKVAKEEDILKINVTLPKAIIAYKFNIKHTRLSKKKINNFITMFYTIKFGQVSEFLEDVQKEGLTNKNIGYNILQTDEHILLLIEMETEKQKELIKRIDDHIKKFDITEQEFNREKKVAISSCIYMSDSIYSLNSFIMNSLIDEDRVNYDIYNYFKNLDYNEFKEFIKTLNFDNKSILYVNNK